MYIKSPQQGFIGKIILIIILGTLFFQVAYKQFIAAPSDFPVPYKLTIEPGQTLFSISKELYADHVIRSPRIFEMFMLTLGSEKTISQGEYSFTEPANALTVAMRITGKDFGINKEKVTFPEGFTNKEMANRFAAVFPNFDTELFLELTNDEQGYLFPDTYSFFPSLEPNLAVSTLKQNFEKKITPLRDDIANSGHSMKDIIIMASIVEKEANGDEDREMVAGILWKRLEQGMPLQVDAPFLFLLGKESKDLTREDLAIKSPYNTYINVGLPPAPINNPGLAAITAVIHPTTSTYLYYLHDAQGKIHYANTYDQHKKNIRDFLE